MHRMPNDTDCKFLVWQCCCSSRPLRHENVTSYQLESLLYSRINFPVIKHHQFLTCTHCAYTAPPVRCGAGRLLRCASTSLTVCVWLKRGRCQVKLVPLRTKDVGGNEISCDRVGCRCTECILRCQTGMHFFLWPAKVLLLHNG